MERVQRQRCEELGAAGSLRSSAAVSVMDLVNRFSSPSKARNRPPAASDGLGRGKDTDTLSSASASFASSGASPTRATSFGGTSTTASSSPSLKSTSSLQTSDSAATTTTTTTPTPATKPSPSKPTTTDTAAQVLRQRYIDSQAARRRGLEREKQRSLAQRTTFGGGAALPTPENFARAARMNAQHEAQQRSEARLMASNFRLTRSGLALMVNSRAREHEPIARARVMESRTRASAHRLPVTMLKPLRSRSKSLVKIMSARRLGSPSATPPSQEQQKEHPWPSRLSRKQSNQDYLQRKTTNPIFAETQRDSGRTPGKGWERESHVGQCDQVPPPPPPLSAVSSPNKRTSLATASFIASRVHRERFPGGALAWIRRSSLKSLRSVASKASVFSRSSRRSRRSPSLSSTPSSPAPQSQHSMSMSSVMSSQSGRASAVESTLSDQSTAFVVGLNDVADNSAVHEEEAELRETSDHAEEEEEEGEEEEGDEQMSVATADAKEGALSKDSVDITDEEDDSDVASADDADVVDDVDDDETRDSMSRSVDKASHADSDANEQEGDGEALSLPRSSSVCSTPATTDDDDEEEEEDDDDCDGNLAAESISEESQTTEEEQVDDFPTLPCTKANGSSDNDDNHNNSNNNDDDDDDNSNSNNVNGREDGDEATNESLLATASAKSLDAFHTAVNAWATQDRFWTMYSPAGSAFSFGSLLDDTGNQR